VKAARQVRRTAERLFKDCRVGRSLDEARVRQAAVGLVGSPRRRSVPVLQEFARLVRLARDQRTATVETAVPIAREVRNAVEQALVRRYGRGMPTRFAHTPALIGGMRVTVGSDVFDGSVRWRLVDLARRFGDGGSEP